MILIRRIAILLFLISVSELHAKSAIDPHIITLAQEKAARSRMYKQLTGDALLESIVEDTKTGKYSLASQKMDRVKNKRDKRLLWAKGMLNRDSNPHQSSKTLLESCQKGYWLGCNGYAMNSAIQGNSKAVYSMAIKYDRKTPKGIYEQLEQARLLHLIGEDKRAQKHIDKVLSIDQKNKPALELRVRMEQSIHGKNNRLKERQAVLERLLR